MLLPYCRNERSRNCCALITSPECVMFSSTWLEVVGRCRLFWSDDATRKPIGSSSGKLRFRTGISVGIPDERILTPGVHVVPQDPLPGQQYGTMQRVSGRRGRRPSSPRARKTKLIPRLAGDSIAPGNFRRRSPRVRDRAGQSTRQGGVPSAAPAGGSGVWLRA